MEDRKSTSRVVQDIMQATWWRALTISRMTNSTVNNRSNTTRPAAAIFAFHDQRFMIANHRYRHHQHQTMPQ